MAHKLSATARRVGTAEFRKDLAKYLKMARQGAQVVILQRGRPAFVLSRCDEAAPVFGCMRDRTEYDSGAVLQAGETWLPGTLP